MSRTITSLVLLAGLGCAALTGCSNTGSATAPALPPAPPTSVSAPAVNSSPAPAPNPAPPLAAGPSPQTGVETSPPAPQAKPAAPAPTGGVAPDLPLDTVAYPPPTVPRTAATTSKDQSYIEALQNGGLTVTATGGKELALGTAVCQGLKQKLSDDFMRQGLLAAGVLSTTLSKSGLNGQQAAELYLNSAKSILC